MPNFVLGKDSGSEATASPELEPILTGEVSPEQHATSWPGLAAQFVSGNLPIHNRTCFFVVAIVLAAMLAWSDNATGGLATLAGLRWLMFKEFVAFSLLATIWIVYLGLGAGVSKTKRCVCFGGAFLYFLGLSALLICGDRIAEAAWFKEMMHAPTVVNAADKPPIIEAAKPLDQNPPTAVGSSTKTSVNSSSKKAPTISEPTPTTKTRERSAPADESMPSVPNEPANLTKSSKS